MIMCDRVCMLSEICWRNIDKKLIIMYLLYIVASIKVEAIVPIHHSFLVDDANMHRLKQIILLVVLTMRNAD